MGTSSRWTRVGVADRDLDFVSESSIEATSITEQTEERHY
jgi:hypothetical protein